MGEPTRILLADDHALVRRGLRLILDAEPDLTVVAEAADGTEAVAAATAGGVDLAVLDIAMPQMTGIQAARQISQSAPEVRVLILSMYDNEQYFFEALRAGASGYVLKSVADRDLIEACRAAIRGESFLYPGAVTALIRDYLERDRRGDRMPNSILTPREEQITKLIAEGNSTKEIAEILRISVKTVDRHRANVLQKLDCATGWTSQGLPSGPGSSSHKRPDHIQEVASERAGGARAGPSCTRERVVEIAGRGASPFNLD